MKYNSTAYQGLTQAQQDLLDKKLLPYVFHFIKDRISLIPDPPADANSQNPRRMRGVNIKQK